MSWRTNREAKTTLLLDMEDGSVGAALARLVPGEPPKMFAEIRSRLVISSTLNPMHLVERVERTAREVLTHSSTVAARIRQNPQVASLGSIAEARVFLSPPWSMYGEERWEYEEALAQSLSEEIAAIYGDIPSIFSPFGKAAGVALRTLLPGQRHLLCLITGEMIELLIIDTDGIHAWGTIPLGSNTIVRTLSTHGGILPSEAQSLLRIAHHSDSPLSNRLMEPLGASGSHFTEQFKDAAAQLLATAPAQGIIVIGEEPAGEWFARTLASDPTLIDLFPGGGTVRALRRSHLLPHIAAHAPQPDLRLMLEALFLVYTQ